MRLSFTLLSSLLLAPAVVSAQTVPAVVAGDPSTPETTRAEELRKAREARQDTVQPRRPTTLEKWIGKIEPLVMPPAVEGTVFRRGFYPRIGSVAPGSAARNRYRAGSTKSRAVRCRCAHHHASCASGSHRGKEKMRISISVRWCIPRSNRAAG